MKNMDEATRNRLAQFLLVDSFNDFPPAGRIDAAVQKFNVSKRTVYYTWKKVLEQRKANLPVHLTSKKVGIVREKRVKIDYEKIKKVPFHQRKTCRDLGHSIQVPKTTVHRWIKEGLIKPHTNAIKPSLTDVNKLSRLYFCLNALSYDVEQNVCKFNSMDSHIHMDEKWFYITKCDERDYMCLDEIEPHRTCQSKNYIAKVMFMCAVSRPLYAENGDLIFDGKIGIWPFTHKVPAKRNSKNRLRGTLETKAIDSVNKEATKQMLLNQIIPAIQAQWPASASKDITIQWDNATPHIKNNDPDFRAAATTNGFNIKIAFQPPNSPDTNVNDLGWFRSIQSLQTEVQARTIDQMVDAVQNSFQNLPHKTLNKVFLTLQVCLRETMQVRGGNNYRIKHLGKDALERRGIILTNLEVDNELVRNCLVYLREARFHSGLEDIMNAMGV